ncbi:MAG: hypothetical protein H0W12_05185 [Chitinophagaceae bacterium]|nr:hypothetical protein [Chitinophagaceae bacterium]
MRNLISLIILLILKQLAFSQDTLPKISVNNISNKILISWTNPFTSLTTINIQRSFDSTKNFSTIGSVLDVKNKKNGFVDAQTSASKMFYRVFISFEGGTYMFSDSYRPVIETTGFLPDVKNSNQTVVNTWFVPSKRIYTGRDNNVIISLAEAMEKKYVVKFFEETGTLLFELKKIAEPWIILDKVNFVHAGMFNFQIYEDGNLIESYKLYIPKEGKPVPGSSEQGKQNSK